MLIIDSSASDNNATELETKNAAIFKKNIVIPQTSAIIAACFFSHYG